MATPNPILESAEAFREALTGGQSQAAGRMLRLYQALLNRFEPNLRVVLDELAAGGDAITPARLFEANRLNIILEQLAGDMADYSTDAGALITDRQKVAIELAQRHAKKFAAQALSSKIGAPDGFTGPTWETVDRKTLENLVGITADGAPFGNELNKLAGQNVERARDILLRNAASGEQPETMVAAVRDDLGGRAGRFLTVARTAEMHAYTASMMEAYEQNADVVKGWRWHASLSFDTCLACLAQHGKEFPLGTPMERHFNCRCIAIPVVATWEELGYPELKELKQTGTTGEQWLSGQSEANQKRALGQTRFELWKSGEVKLDDFAAHGDYPQWGGMVYEASTKNALLKAASREAPTNSGTIADSSAPATLPDPISKKLFGGRTTVTIEDKAEVDAFTKTHFGRKFTKKDWSRLAGAPTGTKLRVSTDYRGEISIVAKANSHVKFLNRQIKLDDQGKPYLYNAHFEAERQPDPSNPGEFKSIVPKFGTRLFAQQVEAARQLGFTRIHTSAAGDVGNRRFNGYYTWPRLGYSAPIPGDKLRLLRAEHPEWADVTDLHGLMDKIDGPAWWKQKGSSIEVDFDLTEGSRSLQRHRDYLEDAGIRPVGLK